MVAYKAINTADSMVGHRTTRHEAFGHASAKVDDVVNLPASRLAALWIALAAWFHDDADVRRALVTGGKTRTGIARQRRLARGSHGRRLV